MTELLVVLAIVGLLGAGTAIVAFIADWRASSEGALFFVGAQRKPHEPMTFYNPPGCAMVCAVCGHTLRDRDQVVWSEQGHPHPLAHASCRSYGQSA